MTWWLDPGFLAFDTETTGVDGSKDRVVTASVVLFRDGEPVDSTSWLIKLDIPIPSASTDIHGITDAMSQRDGMDEREALTQIRSQLGQGLPIVAFNAVFDIAMLNGNLRRLGEPAMVAEVVLCPMILDKHFNKYVRGSNQRRLAPTAARYGLELSEDDWHGAEPDAVMAGKIFLAQVDAYPELQSYQPGPLARDVALWRQQQEEEFRAWLASKNS